MKEAYDVCIFGAGPAGAATAIRMADSGFAPLVFERPHREKPWGGESFSGAIRQPLMALGLWEVFGAAGHVASYEQRLAWGGEPWTKGTIFNPLGNLWHVDRGRFDQDLRQAVCARGVPLLDYRHLDELRWDGKEWRIRVDQGAAIGAHLVDATGRAGAVARRLGARPVVHDRLVALASVIQRNPRQDLPHAMIIEATPHGWCYAAPVPQGHVVVFLTDSDLAPRDLARRMRTLSANSVFTECETSRGWLAVGDACAAYDPLRGWLSRSGERHSGGRFDHPLPADIQPLVNR
jgi:flavin-dependent dehydrogenase